MLLSHGVKVDDTFSCFDTTLERDIHCSSAHTLSQFGPININLKSFTARPAISIRSTGATENTGVENARRSELESDTGKGETKTGLENARMSNMES